MVHDEEWPSAGVPRGLQGAAIVALGRVRRREIDDEARGPAAPPADSSHALRAPNRPFRTAPPGTSTFPQGPPPP
eukprot:94420-Pyramimonas_sp.AAC.1